MDRGTPTAIQSDDTKSCGTLAAIKAGGKKRTWRFSVKVGDLVRYRTTSDWLGLIVREIPGTDEIKVIEWTHRDRGSDRGPYRARDLVLVSASR